MSIAFSEMFDRRLMVDGVTVAYAVREDDDGQIHVDLEVHADRATARRLHPVILDALRPAESWTVISHYAGGSSELIHP